MRFIVVILFPLDIMFIVVRCVEASMCVVCVRVE